MGVFEPSSESTGKGLLSILIKSTVSDTFSTSRSMTWPRSLPSLTAWKNCRLGRFRARALSKGWDESLSFHYTHLGWQKAKCGQERNPH